MLPTKNVYGPWPLSGNDQSSSLISDQSTHFHSTGEIDIVDSRGNGIEYTAQYASSCQTINYQLTTIQWLQLCSRFIKLGPNNLSRRCIKITQLVDWETNIIRIRLSYLRFRMDARFLVSSLLLSPLSSPPQNTLIANLNRRIYVDTRLHTLLDFRFNQPFFQRGDLLKLFLMVRD